MSGVPSIRISHAKFASVGDFAKSLAQLEDYLKAASNLVHGVAQAGNLLIQVKNRGAEKMSIRGLDLPPHFVMPVMGAPPLDRFPLILLGVSRPPGGEPVARFQRGPIECVATLERMKLDPYLATKEPAVAEAIELLEALE